MTTDMVTRPRFWFERMTRQASPALPFSSFYRVYADYGGDNARICVGDYFSPADAARTVDACRNIK